MLSILRRRPSGWSALCPCVTIMIVRSCDDRLNPPNREAVELATLKWVDWFNNGRILSSIGNIPPAEAEARFYAQQKSHALAA
jgi:transposase InsO family protein